MVSKSIQDRKARFVKELEKFYINDCGNDLDIKRLDYVCIDDETEFIYISFLSYSQKRMYVNGTNANGMFLDFARFAANHDRYDWIVPKSPEFIKAFLED